MLLKSTYLCACSNVFLSRETREALFLFFTLNPTCLLLPNGLPLGLRRLVFSIKKESSFRLDRLKGVSTLERYREQNIKHSLAKYPSAMDPSGCARLRTNDFKAKRNLTKDFKLPNKIISFYYKIPECYEMIEKNLIPFNVIHPSVMNRSCKFCLICQMDYQMYHYSKKRRRENLF